MADDINKRREALQAELNLQQMLTDAVKTHKAVSNQALGIKESLIEAMQEEKDLADKINNIDKAIGDLLLEQVQRGEEVNQHYIEQLNGVKQILKLKEKEKQAEDAELKYLNTKKGILNSILGIDNEIEEAVMNGTFKALLLQKAFDNVSANVSAMKDSMKDTMTELGVGVGEAAILQGNIEQASFSLTGMLYGSEKMAISAREIAKEYGSVEAASSDMIKAVTEVSTLTGDVASAADLVHVFEDAGVEAGEVKGIITDIANDAGISAQKAMEGMTGQMSQLVGKSEAQLKTILKSNAALVKQGTNLSQIQGISDSMLDIESSMKASAKARIMLGRDMNTEAVRQASLELQMARTEDDRAAAAAKISAEILKGVGGMEQFAGMTMKEKDAAAAAYGMSTDELTTMMEKKKVQDEMTEKYGAYAGFMEKAAGFAKSGLALAKDTAIEAVKLVAQYSIMNLMQGKGTGLGNLNPFKKTGGGGGSPIETEVPGSDDVAPKAQGSEGGLKSLAEGLKAMGDGKVFAGIVAVALAGPAFIVALPSIPFLLFMGKVKLKQLEENFGGLGRGLAQMPQGILGALTMAIAGPALALGMLAIPFLAFMSIPAIGPIMQANFTALAAGLAAFGNPATAVFVLIGIGLMALLGAAMIPFAYALSLLSPLVEAFGNIIVGVFAAVPPIIEAVANGFVTMMSALTPEAIMGLMLLGPALLLASVGMVAFSAAMLVGGLGSFFGGGIIDDITQLAMIGPQLSMAGEGLAAITTNLSEVSGVIENLASSLSEMGSVTTPLFQVAAGLYSIAGGLMSVSMAGLLAFPAIGGLIALASVAPILESIGVFGGGNTDSNESTSSNSNNSKELINEIKGLRSDIQSQPILISVDGKVVSRISRLQAQQGSSRAPFQT
jgi:hypothetical protein